MGRDTGIILKIKNANDEIISLLEEYRIRDYNSYYNIVDYSEETKDIEIDLLYLRKCNGIADDLLDILSEYSYKDDEGVTVYRVNIDNIDYIIDCIGSYEDYDYFEQWMNSSLYSYYEFIDIAMACKAALLKYKNFLQKAPIWFEYECYFYDSY